MCVRTADAAPRRQWPMGASFESRPHAPRGLNVRASGRRRASVASLGRDGSTAPAAAGGPSSACVSSSSRSVRSTWSSVHRLRLLCAHRHTPLESSASALIAFATRGGHCAPGSAMSACGSTDGRAQKHRRSTHTARAQRLGAGGGPRRDRPTRRRTPPRTRRPACRARASSVCASGGDAAGRRVGGAGGGEARPIGERLVRQTSSVTPTAYPSVRTEYSPPLMMIGSAYPGV